VSNGNTNQVDGLTNHYGECEETLISSSA